MQATSALFILQIILPASLTLRHFSGGVASAILSDLPLVYGRGRMERGILKKADQKGRRQIQWPQRL